MSAAGDASCACGRRAKQRCSSCGKPLCDKHATFVARESGTADLPGYMRLVGMMACTDDPKCTREVSWDLHLRELNGTLVPTAVPTAKGSA